LNIDTDARIDVSSDGGIGYAVLPSGEMVHRLEQRTIRTEWNSPQQGAYLKTNFDSRLASYGSNFDFETLTYQYSYLNFSANQVFTDYVDLTKNDWRYKYISISKSSGYYSRQIIQGIKESGNYIELVDNYTYNWSLSFTDNNLENIFSFDDLKAYSMPEIIDVLENTQDVWINISSERQQLQLKYEQRKERTIIDNQVSGEILYGRVRFTSLTVPEPSTLAIFALGIMGLASRRFKKQ